MDELDMRLTVHMMDIAKEMNCSVIEEFKPLKGPHFIFNFTWYEDEVIERHLEKKGIDSLTIDLTNHFD